MLLACASYVVAQGTGLLLVGKLEPSTAAALRGAAAIASVFGFFLVRACYVHSFLRLQYTYDEFSWLPWRVVRSACLCVPESAAAQSV